MGAQSIFRLLSNKISTKTLLNRTKETEVVRNLRDKRGKETGTSDFSTRYSTRG